MSEILWKPTPERIAQANATRFLQAVEQDHEVALSGFPALRQWSVDFPDLFWSSMWKFGEIIHSRPADAVVHGFDRMPGAQWFPGARLNFAENLLRFRDDREALVSWNELGKQQTLTYQQLFGQVARAARGLRALGVRPGDRVAGFLPNIPEAVVAMLAATSLGAAWSSTSPDFGTQGVLDRLGQIKPKVLFAADGCRYNGKVFDSLDRVGEIVREIPSIEQTVVAGYLNATPSLDDLPGAASFADFLGDDEPVPEIAFEQLPFDHPVYIMYSSGTTGVPKCIVHGAGGTLIQHLKEHLLHVDLKPNDRVFYFTTCGWMMWNWLVSALAVGSTVVLYDGSPFVPGPEALWDMAESERLTVFGTSAKYLSALEKSGFEPGDRDLSALKTILSTGSPLLSESYDFVYDKIKQDVCLSSISGGTDLISCFALGDPTGPVRRGELQTRGLGMNVQVFDEQAKPVVGEQGELVCVDPFPSMPVGFWNDPDGQKYHRAYFDVYPGVWRHGDFVRLTEQGGMIFYGRSDAVLNPGGVRIGTAEIYRVVEKFPEILDAVAVGQDHQGDVRVILFVQARPDVELDAALIQHIQQRVRKETTSRHVPAKILQVADVPRTLSGKVTELAVREIIHGRPVKNRDALANPESLEHFRDRPELQA
ncbi:MAG: acetoacetate--CoA ligase [Planctomycetales bacterium]